MKRIGIIGYFGYSVKKPIIGGQLGKTRGIQRELIRVFGKEQVICVDTSNWKRGGGKLFGAILSASRKCDIILILPNKKGIRVILPLIVILKKRYGFSIVFPVVGGWLPQLLNKYRYLSKYLKEVDLVLPETHVLDRSINPFYVGDTIVISAFSHRQSMYDIYVKRGGGIIDTKDLRFGLERESIHDPNIRFCTFSRVLPQKGIDEVIAAISLANKNGTRCYLDIWGPIDPLFRVHYTELFSKYKDYVQYKGEIDYCDDISVLSQYRAMIFPSKYETEGFPISVCESFLVGLPVIASDWEYNKEIISEGKNGLLFKSGSINSLLERIEFCVNNQEAIDLMSLYALESGRKLAPSIVLKPLFEWMNVHREKEVATK